MSQQGMGRLLLAAVVCAWRGCQGVTGTVELEQFSQNA
jgi:hypothetical protein